MFWLGGKSTRLEKTKGEQRRLAWREREREKLPPLLELDNSCYIYINLQFLKLFLYERTRVLPRKLKYKSPTAIYVYERWEQTEEKLTKTKKQQQKTKKRNRIVTVKWQNERFFPKSRWIYYNLTDNVTVTKAKRQNFNRQLKYRDCERYTYQLTYFCQSSIAKCRKNWIWTDFQLNMDEFSAHDQLNNSYSQ